MNGFVALTGATGYVGRFVVAELQRQGLPIRALARPASDRSGFGTPPEWISGDLLNDNARLVVGARAVIHLAYEHMPGRYRGGEGDNLPAWLDANLNGSLRLLLAAQAAGVERFIFLSSRAVFSRTEPGRVLDETHPTAPDSHYGAYKAAVEAFMHSVKHTSGMQTCTVRATGVYGLTWPPARSKWWPLVQAVLHDEPIPLAGGGTEVHGDDVARAIHALLTAPEMPDALHLSDLFVTHREVVRLAREIAGKPGTLPPAPKKPPTNVLVSRHLDALGVTLGGVPLLERTVRDLVNQARSGNISQS